MFIRQLYTGCLSESAYFIESNGEAAVIDPLRDIEVYLELARERKATIRYIFETHFHADFVSGHLDLAAATGATIVYGPPPATKYPVHIAKDGETFSLGDVTIEVLHTPGHTLESCCYLLKDASGKTTPFLPEILCLLVMLADQIWRRKKMKLLWMIWQACCMIVCKRKSCPWQMM